MLIDLSAYKSIATLLLVLFGPSLLPKVISLYTRRARPRIPTLPTQCLLVFHTIYTLLKLLRPGPDLFATLPIFTSNATLKRSFTSLGPLEDLLLSKLQSLDNRLNYVRFGHETMINCVWGEHTLDYLLYSLPSILQVYAWEGIFVGLLGFCGFGKWRKVIGWGLGLMCFGEVGAKYFWDVRVENGDCTRVFTSIHTLRQSILLLLPLYTLLPSSSPPDPIQILNTLTQTSNTLRLTGLTRTAIERDGRLTRLRQMHAEEERRALGRARGDKGVQEAIKASGIDIGTVKAGAGRWIRNGWEGLVKVGQ